MSELDLSIYSAQHQPCMHRLEFLEIHRTEITEIFFPQGVCPNLKHLDIQDCKNLVTVGGLPHTLITVKLFACEKLGEIGGLCNLTELQELNIGGSEVEHLQGLERLISLKKLKANSCRKLERIPGLAQLTKLRELEVNYSRALEELLGVENMMSLEKLSAINCSRLRLCREAEERLKSLRDAFANKSEEQLKSDVSANKFEEQLKSDASSTF